MTELFMKLLNMSINAGWLVLTVLLVRIIFRKAPKWLFPVLWSFVWIRLLMPNALESRLSVIPDISGFSASEQGLLSAKGFTAPVPYVGIVWCTGMAAMLLFEALSYVHLRSKVKTAVRLSSNVYQSEHVNAPFILGLFAPRIYIPFHIKSKELDSIIAHERAHIKRRDHWLKPIAFLILSLYWFNPLIWIAYYFLCKDIELACDEYAIKDMSDSQRAAYSQTLLSCTANQRIFAACPLAFGSKNVKTRIRAVLSYRKPHTWIITVTAILVLAVVACFMTNPRQPKESTAQGSNYIDLNQPPTLDVIQNGQTISDRSSSEDRQREVELESALLGEAIKKQESLIQIQRFFQNTYAPIGGRMYINDENALRIDFARNITEDWRKVGFLSDDEYYYLVACIVEGIPFVSNISGTYGAFHKEWERRSYKKYELLRLPICTNGKKIWRRKPESMKNIMEE